jgi:ATP-dependent protease ClpP protease subunit
MPNWKAVIEEVQLEAKNGITNPFDVVRRKYISLLHKKTNRNVIAYYSGWLQKPSNGDVIINDKDKNAFMANVHKFDRKLGLDLILHTPGGDLAATESIVDYLHKMFDGDIRAIIPQIAMSAGTMIALSCTEIIMGKQSNLGPIDPQMGGVACQSVLDEFQQALEDVKTNPSAAALWQVIISKYHPTFLGACKNSIEWSEKLVGEWLSKNMCKGDEKLSKKVLKEFGDHKENKSHARHISTERCKEIGLNILDMESDPDLQDLILTIHHSYMHTFSHSTATKIVENQLGIAYIESVPTTPR